MNRENGKPLKTGHETSEDHPLRMEAERSSTTEVLDNIISFPGGDYGAENVHDFLEGFVDRVLANKDKVHMMFAGGEPGNGKTAVLHEAMAKIYLPQSTLEKGRKKRTQLSEATRLVQGARAMGYVVRFHNFPWGDASEYLDDDWYIDKKADYHEDPLLRNGKQREVNYAEKVLQASIIRKAEECLKARANGEKVINIFIGDVPINTGEVIDGEQYGIVRAQDMIRGMMHHEGAFAHIKDSYEASFFTLSASTDVREKAYLDRQIMANPALTEEQRKKLLLKKGTNFDTDDEETEALIREVAPPGQMDLIEQDVNEVLIPLHAQADPKLRPGFRYEDQITFDALKGRKEQLRVPMIGAIQLPHILKEVVRVPKAGNIGNFLNAKIVDRVDMFGWLVNSRPIAEMRETIKQEIRQTEATTNRDDFAHTFYQFPLWAEAPQD